MTIDTTVEELLQPTAHQVFEAVYEKTYGRIQDLEIDEYDGQFCLFGTSTTYYLKQLATEAVSQQFPRLPISNQIEVR